MFGQVFGDAGFRDAKMFGEQLDRDSDGYLKMTNYVFTKVPGVYACGDVVDRRYRDSRSVLDRTALGWFRA